jgi:opacity protein-like surface antigen
MVLLGTSLASADVIQQFAIGVRTKGWDLTGSKNYTGSITGETVSEKQELYPTNFNMLFLFCPYGGLSVEWDRYTAVMEQDGKQMWDTFTLGLNVRLPVENFPVRFAPYGVLGVTYNNPQFSEENWWRYGWNSKQEFDNFMSRQNPPYNMDTGRVRNFSTDASFGVTYGVGVDFFLTEHLALNLDLRWNIATTDVHYTIVSDDGRDTLLQRDFNYNLETVAYGIGFRWYF